MKMKNTIISLPAVALVLSSISVSGFGQNLLTNGDFEVNLSNPDLVDSNIGYFIQYGWDAGEIEPSSFGWSSTTTAGAAGSADNYWVQQVNSPNDWLGTTEQVPAFVNSSLSGGLAGGMRVFPETNAGRLTFNQTCQTVNGLTGDYNFDGVFAVPSIDPGLGSEGVVSFNTYFNGVLNPANSGVVGTLNDQQTMEFSQTISQANGSFDAIEVCFSIESLDGKSSYVAVDGFSLTAVPEASSAILLGLGALGLIARRRR